MNQYCIIKFIFQVKFEFNKNKINNLKKFKIKHSEHLLPDAINALIYSWKYFLFLDFMDFKKPIHKI